MTTGYDGYDGYDAFLYFFGHIARVKDKKWENPSYASYVSLANDRTAPHRGQQLPEMPLDAQRHHFGNQRNGGEL